MQGSLEVTALIRGRGLNTIAPSALQLKTVHKAKGGRAPMPLERDETRGKEVSLQEQRERVSERGREGERDQSKL